MYVPIRLFFFVYTTYYPGPGYDFILIASGLPNTTSFLPAPKLTPLLLFYLLKSLGKLYNPGGGVHPPNLEASLNLGPIPKLHERLGVRFSQS